MTTLANDPASDLGDQLTVGDRVRAVYHSTVTNTEMTKAFVVSEPTDGGHLCLDPIGRGVPVVNVNGLLYTRPREDTNLYSRPLGPLHAIEVLE